MICLVLKNFEETLRVKQILSELTFSVNINNQTILEILT